MSFQGIFSEEKMGSAHRADEEIGLDWIGIDHLPFRLMMRKVENVEARLDDADNQFVRDIA